MGFSARAPSQSFSNLVFSVSGSNKVLVVEIKAKHFLEPIGSVLVLIENEANEFEAKPINEDPYKGGFNAAVRLDNGVTTNAFLVTVFRGITPLMPLRVQLIAKDGYVIRFQGILHQKSNDRWVAVPQEQSPIVFPRFGIGGDGKGAAVV